MRKEAGSKKEEAVQFGDLFVWSHHLCFDWKAFGFHKQQTIPFKRYTSRSTRLEVPRLSLPCLSLPCLSLPSLSLPVSHQPVSHYPSLTTRLSLPVSH